MIRAKLCDFNQLLVGKLIAQNPEDEHDFAIHGKFGRGLVRVFLDIFITHFIKAMRPQKRVNYCPIGRSKGHGGWGP
jgi:hypothetical protein